jgi:drug/metabolite transporter (DMT)-like permease
MTGDVTKPAITRKPHLWIAVAAMILSAACWGLATVMTKSVLATMPPFTLLAIQLGASIAFLWIATVATRQKIDFDRRSGRMALSGLLEPGLAYGVGVPGLAMTSAAHASVIGAAEPALVSILAWLLLKERPNIAVSAAIFAAMIGVTLVSLADAEAGGTGSSAGDLLVLAGTVFAALYVVSSRLFVAEIAPLPLATLQQTVGFLFALVLFAGVWLSGLETLPRRRPPETLLFAATSGLVQYALAFWFYLVGLRTLPASTAALFLTLIPVFGVGGAMLFLGETMAPSQWIGCGLVLAAIFAMALLLKKDEPAERNL